MNQDELGRYIRDKREMVDHLDIKDRELALPIGTDHITTIIGPRRCGKSYLLFTLMREDVPSLYLNFEDIELLGTKLMDAQALIVNYAAIFGEHPVRLLFDEVQALDGWEKLIGELYETKRYEIVLTGSSSKLLAKEIASRLRGRGIKYSLYPLSFNEYLRFNDLTVPPVPSSNDMVEAMNHLSHFLKNGGFPDVVKNPGISGKYFEEYIDLVIYKDLVERYGITELATMKHLIRACLASYTKEFSVNKIYNALRSQGIQTSKTTLYSYFSYIEDSMFIHRHQKFSWSIRSSEQSRPKIYISDTGLACFSNGFHAGNAMENAVIIELMRRADANPPTELFYHHDPKGEVDAVVVHRGKVASLIQVTYELEPANEKRECASLAQASDELHCDDLLIITWSQEGDRQWDGKRMRLVPLWKWLLGKPIGQ